MYQVKLADFEGPLDLLIHLIEKDKIDIYDIPIVSVTEQYVAYLNAMQEYNLDVASEFLLMAAMLLQIKSRMLLPKPPAEEGEEEADPRQMLVDTQPDNFNTLVRLSGFSHGTDVWLGNARDLIVSGTATVLETVGCRDDIMLYLISMGLDPKMSFKIMEAVRKGKVKKGGFQEGWEEAMREHQVPDWYIESLAKIGYLFPKAHAVAYVMMAFRIAWFKVHRPLAFYATFFSIRAKAFDAEYCCAGIDAVKRKIREIESNKDATAVEQDLMVTLEVCYEFYLRGFHFETINIYESDATHFRIIGDDGLLPPFTSVHGLGEAAAMATVEQRKGKEFISVEEFAQVCNKLSKTHIEQLRALGAFAGMAETSQVSLF